MKSNNPLKETAILFLLLTLGIWGASNLAASGNDGQPDVVVQKHADGSVDVFDKQAGSSAHNSSPAPDNEAPQRPATSAGKRALPPHAVRRHKTHEWRQRAHESRRHHRDLRQRQPAGPSAPQQESKRSKASSREAQITNSLLLAQANYNLIWSCQVETLAGQALHPFR